MDAESGRGPTPATPDAERASSRLRRRREAEASGAERPVRSRGGVESSRRVRRADEVEWLGMVRIGSIVLRVRDLRLQAEFWAAALDYVPREEQSDDFLLLHPRTGVGPNPSLDLHDSTAHLPPRIISTCTQTTRSERSGACWPSGPPRCPGTSDRPTPTTSSWRTPRATASAWWTRSRRGLSDVTC